MGPPLAKFKQHRQRLVVSVSDAAGAFPKVELSLELREVYGPPGSMSRFAYARWRAGRPPDTPLVSNDIAVLLECMDAANEAVRYRERESPQPLLRTHTADFATGLKHVAVAARPYWVCFVFEAAYFLFIVWFGFWPYLRRTSVKRKLLHIAVVPFLVYLPLWFGYCNPASPAFPRGGILYPWLCVAPRPFPESFNWEYKFLATLPPFLSVITQGRIVVYADYWALKNATPNQFGPVNVAILSATLTSIIGGIHLAAHLRCKHLRNRPGFPVLDVRPVSSPVAAENSVPKSCRQDVSTTKLNHPIASQSDHASRPWQSRWPSCLPCSFVWDPRHASATAR